jgi:peptide-methionine (S)-S-oxide reductase
VRTRVGYTGGTTRSPTYHRLGDHTEAFQLDFDPARVTYDELLELFWTSHRCDRGTADRQYMAAVWCGSAAQLAAAHASRERQLQRHRSCLTPVAELGSFYLAEDYHQKYYLRRHADLMAAFAGYTPRELVDSTVAARLNGYVAGRGTAATLRAEIAGFGLPPEATDRLVRRVEHAGF